MNETVINFDSKKRSRILLFGIAMTIAALVFVYYMVVIAAVIKIYYVLLFLLLAGMSIYMLVAGIRDKMDKDKSGLVLNEEGIVFKGTPVARKIGFIKWADVESLATGKVYGSSFIFLKLSDPKKYLQHISAQVQANIITQGVGITNNELTIEFSELKSLIEQYYYQFQLRGNKND
jgi:hypothetical protein